MTPETPDLPRLRTDYPAGSGLSAADLAPQWPAQFAAWMAEAVAAGVPEPNAMVLATADPSGRPSARTVLLKGYDAGGFIFYTNLESLKGRQARANPYASLVFPWLPLHRQVVVCGQVRLVPREEVRRYFALRPRGAQLGAWASQQSAVIESRRQLRDRYAEVSAQFPEPEPVPPPEHWGGLRVVPETVEFWQGRPDRLHDRLRYRCTGPEQWVVERLSP